MIIRKNVGLRKLETPRFGVVGLRDGKQKLHARYFRNCKVKAADKVLFFYKYLLIKTFQKHVDLWVRGRAPRSPTSPWPRRSRRELQGNCLDRRGLLGSAGLAELEPTGHIVCI